ncbi:MAG TPA: hypothetical protein VFV58_31240 [Blastocatellia bacterium]|jgi:hypothetical protein|nr:hypothetical protein [Blastocatellia bacterium]
MWSARTVWFDIAVVMSVFAVGNILFGHFEERKPMALRLLSQSLTKRPHRLSRKYPPA